ncbi:MAG: hypothetical protein ACRDPY_13625 [Streptosporangiaceae bacterium]
MDSGSPSRTSQAVALTRAGMTRPYTAEGDPDAQRRLCEGMQPLRRPQAGSEADPRLGSSGEGRSLLVVAHPA